MSGFTGLRRRGFDGVLLLTFITNNTNKAKNNFVVSQRINASEVVTPTAVFGVSCPWRRPSYCDQSV